jgi:hypothetical protein
MDLSELQAGQRPVQRELSHLLHGAPMMHYGAKNEQCTKCKATYLNGVPHTCHHDNVDAARARLEGWLGEGFTIEGPA